MASDAPKASDADGARRASDDAGSVSAVRTGVQLVEVDGVFHEVEKVLATRCINSVDEVLVRWASSWIPIDDVRTDDAAYKEGCSSDSFEYEYLEDVILVNQVVKVKIRWKPSWVPASSLLYVGLGGHACNSLYSTAVARCQFENIFQDQA
ncbi:hypothetical protein ATCC90586_008498 [Pythium insidiosum]|nr:hypothetical protein ATCC90586_008498 [Pythium insidiosum]